MNSRLPLRSKKSMQLAKSFLLCVASDCRENFIRPEALATKNRHGSPVNLELGEYNAVKPFLCRIRDDYGAALREIGMCLSVSDVAVHFANLQSKKVPAISGERYCLCRG